MYKTRYLHVATYSWVPPLHCVAGECSNGCWGAERRTSGFTCEYSATHTGYVITDDNGGPFASYNEIKSLNPHDAIAVENCRRQRGGRPLRTYTVWNGTGWDSEGIAARIHFAELFGTQSEATPHMWTWFANARGTYSPMTNLSPEPDRFHRCSEPSRGSARRRETDGPGSTTTASVRRTWHV